MLVTPETTRTLQGKLYAKAKREPAFRFYPLYDKLARAVRAVLLPQQPLRAEPLSS